jgi:hypothetical protein
LRYQFTGISDRFRAGSGFISRNGIVHAAVDHRATWFGAKGSKLETLTGDFLLDDQWQYTHFFNHGDAQDKKAHLSGSAGLRGGWNAGLGFYLETFGFDNGLYSSYKIQSPTGVIPFVGTPRITNHDYVATLATPQWKKFSGNLLYVGGQDENFFEWAQADINLLIASVSVRPSDRARVQGDLQFQDYHRRSDNSLVGRNAIPRVKLEYQLTRSVFMRVVCEYDLAQTDDLRDETRTNYPLLVNGSLAKATRSRTLHGDYLFSYTPNPGTVLFFGYGGQGDGLPDPAQRFNWQPIHRTSDYFFVKYGYLFRM